MKQRRRKQQSFFEMQVPHATTRKAMAELEVGQGKRFSSVDALMADLNAERKEHRVCGENRK